MDPTVYQQNEVSSGGRNYSIWEQWDKYYPNKECGESAIYKVYRYTISLYLRAYWWRRASNQIDSRLQNTG